MKWVTYYDRETGEITSVKKLKDDAEVSQNRPFGVDFIPGRYDPNTQRIEGGIAVHSDPTPEPVTPIEVHWLTLRQERNARLAASEWTQVADNPLTEAQRVEWRVYRQALRDLPDNTNDPANPVWPEQPA